MRNDVSITGSTRILLVSGSQHVRQKHIAAYGRNQHCAGDGRRACTRPGLRLTEMQIGASIRINDSLHEGSSRFYAEIIAAAAAF